MLWRMIPQTVPAVVRVTRRSVGPHPAAAMQAPRAVAVLHALRGVLQDMAEERDPLEIIDAAGVRQ